MQANKYILGTAADVHGVTRGTLPKPERDLTDHDAAEAIRKAKLHATSAYAIDKALGKQEIVACIKTCNLAKSSDGSFPPSIATALASSNQDVREKWTGKSTWNKYALAQCLSRWRQFGAFSKRHIEELLKAKSNLFSELVQVALTSPTESSMQRRRTAVASWQGCDLTLGDPIQETGAVQTFERFLEEESNDDIVVPKTGNTWTLRKVSGILPATAKRRGDGRRRTRVLRTIRRHQRTSFTTLRADEMARRRDKIESWNEGKTLVDDRHRREEAQRARVPVSIWASSAKAIPAGVPYASFKQARDKGLEVDAAAATAAAAAAAAATAAAAIAAAATTGAIADGAALLDQTEGRGEAAPLATTTGAGGEEVVVTDSHIRQGVAFVERELQSGNLTRWCWSEARRQGLLASVGMAGQVPRSVFCARLEKEIAQQRKLSKQRQKRHTK